jgi:hypothetical protein
MRSSLRGVRPIASGYSMGITSARRIFATDVGVVMAEKPTDAPEIAELSEVYGMLKRDAKDMLHDLLDGVTLWRSTARILFGIAVIAFILGLLFLWSATRAIHLVVAAPGFLNELTSFFNDLSLIGVFMLGLGAVTTLAGAHYRRKYYSLRRKYSELFETAKKLG